MGAWVQISRMKTCSTPVRFPFSHPSLPFLLSPFFSLFVFPFFLLSLAPPPLSPSPFLSLFFLSFSSSLYPSPSPPSFLLSLFFFSIPPPLPLFFILFCVVV